MIRWFSQYGVLNGGIGILHIPQISGHQDGKSQGAEMNWRCPVFEETQKSYDSWLVVF
jgi:hypothetical protein